MAYTDGKNRILGTVEIHSTSGTIDIANIQGTVDVSNIENIGTIQTLINAQNLGTVQTVVNVQNLGTVQNIVTLGTLSEITSLKSGSVGIIAGSLGRVDLVGTVGEITSLKSGSVGILGGTVNVGAIGTISEITSVKSGSVGVLARRFGSATPFSVSHIGGGSTLSTGSRDVSEFSTKSIGMLLQGAPGKFSVYAQFSDEAGTMIFNDNLNQDDLRVITFEDAFRQIQANVLANTEGTLTVSFGEQT